MSKRVTKAQFLPTTIDFPICFDLSMATLAQSYGLDFRLFFSDCLKTTFNKDGKSLDEILTFPFWEDEKYKAKGVKIQKVHWSELNKNDYHLSGYNIIHFDGFYCKWDRACYKKRHNDHLVLLNDGKTIYDLYFNKKKRITTKLLSKASGFFYSCQFPQVLPDIREEPHELLAEFQKNFSDCVSEIGKRKTLLRPNGSNPFSMQLFRFLQRVRISLYFYRNFLQIYKDCDKIKVIDNDLESIDNLFSSALLYIIKAIWAHEYEEDVAFNKLEKIAETLNEVGKTDYKMVGDYNLKTIENFRQISLDEYFNCKMFLPNDQCERSDFIEGDHLCVCLNDLKDISYGNLTIALAWLNDKDNIRCIKQEISVQKKCRGMIFLVVAENGSFIGDFNFITDRGDLRYKKLITDFPRKTDESINIGQGYDLSRYCVFKNVYARIAAVDFKEPIFLQTVVLPNQSHLHIIATGVIV